MSNPLHHLVVANEANSAAYRRLAQTSVPGECWDILVLTAADEKQAEGYRRELALRARSADSTAPFFPAVQRSIVVTDPPGRRAGSGGATLGVLKALRRELDITPENLTQLRILLIHSGGADLRLPMYSAVGKIFAPLPLLRPDGQIATLFDHLYLTLCGLPDKLGPGMLILAGDVFLLFDHRQVGIPGPGVSAITMRVPADLGTGHGVFLADADGLIRQTLQKATVQQMSHQGAIDPAGQILIDTGILFFDAPTTLALSKLAGAAGKTLSPGLHEKHSSPIDLYQDITFALSSATSKREYLTADRRGARAAIWKALHGTPFHAVEVGGEFLHLGTTAQFRDAMTGRSTSPAAELFQHNVLHHSQWTIPIGPRVYHSALLKNSESVGELGPGSVVDHSILGGRSRIGRDCVVSQVVAVDSPLTLPDQMLFFQVPIRYSEGAVQKSSRFSKQSSEGLNNPPIAYAQVLCGAADDFTGSLRDNACTFLNAPITQFLTRHKLTPRQIWGKLPSERQTLWHARLFPATRLRDDCRKAAWLASSRPVSRQVIDRWLAGPRVSMAMIMEMSDPAGLIEHREIVAAYLQTGQILELIRRRQATPADALFAYHSTPAAYSVARNVLEAFASRPTQDPLEALEHARAQWVSSQLLARPGHPDAIAARADLNQSMQQAFAHVVAASELGYRCLRTQDHHPTILPIGTIVEASSPVRLDLTGGWTDTPPYCYEEGGHVINVAIDLENRPPIRAAVSRLREHKIILESRDLGRSLTTTAKALSQTQADPKDPFALLIVALKLTGFLDLKQPLGIHVTTECRVPKGSGLGTSSILAATLLAALLRLAGRLPSTDELIERTLLLEQRLSTGGGWQDQVGGLVGGVKSTTTSPGIPQRPIVEQLSMSASQIDQLESRLVVYFSGQQRLARDILRRVEGRWLAREPAAVMLKRELKTSAAIMRSSMLAGDFKIVSDEINRYWRIKKQLYPGSTTPTVDVLFLELQGQYDAASLAGAGGGGFGYLLCASPEQARQVRDSLAARGNRPGSLTSVYETRINRTGLQVQVH